MFCGALECENKMLLCLKYQKKNEVSPMTATVKAGVRRSNLKTRSNDTVKETPGRFTLLVVLVQTVSFAAVALADYLIVFLVATSLVPVAMASMADGLGLDPVNAPLSGFTVWLVCSLALMLFLVVLTLIVMRALWHLRTRGIVWARGQRGNR